MALFSQYCRIEQKAGGVCASRREIIRQALRKIKKRSRYSRETRDSRHIWLREILAHHDSAIAMYSQFR